MRLTVKLTLGVLLPGVCLGWLTTRNERKSCIQSR